MFIDHFGVENQFLGVIIQRFSCVLEFTAVDPLDVNEFRDLCDELAGPIESRFLLPMWVKYVCCVHARDLGMKPKAIDDHPMWRISECRVRFGNCGRPFSSPTMYRRALTKKVEMLVSLFCLSRNFWNVSTNAVHLPQLPSWVHWYRQCIVSGDLSQQDKRLVEACPCSCIIVMVYRVLLINFVMKCNIWTVVLSYACSNGVSSISSQSAMLVSFLSAQYRSIRCLEISKLFDWARLE